jgi:hypothetical protein
VSGFIFCLTICLYPGGPVSSRLLRTFVLLGCATIAACGEGSGLVAIAGSADAATVQFVNASASPLDLAVGGTLPTANANVAPGSRVACFSLPDPTVPGLSVRLAGTTTDVSGFAPTFSRGGRFTIVAFPGPSGTIQLVNVPTTSAPAAGRSALRIFNGSLGLGSVDVYVTVPGTALGTPTATGLGVGAVTAALDVNTGIVQVRLTDTGTTTVVFDAGNRVLDSGKSYTLVISSATAAVLVPDC